MPIYEYECTMCGRVREILASHYLPKVFFTKCSCIKIGSCRETFHKRIISKCNFHLKGPGWSRDNYEDRPWGNKEYHKAVKEDGYIPGSYVKTGKARFKNKD